MTDQLESFHWLETVDEGFAAMLAAIDSATTSIRMEVYIFRLSPIGESVRDALRMCAQLGLKLEARGDGFAAQQYPTAGTEVGAGQTVRVDFTRRN